MKYTKQQVEDAIRDAKTIVARAHDLPPLGKTLGEEAHVPLAFAMAFVSMGRMHSLSSREMHALVTASYLAVPPNDPEPGGCTHPLMKRVQGDEFNPPSCLCGAKEWKPGEWS